MSCPLSINARMLDNTIHHPLTYHRIWSSILKYRKIRCLILTFCHKPVRVPNILCWNVRVLFLVLSSVEYGEWFIYSCYATSSRVFEDAEECRVLKCIFVSLHTRNHVSYIKKKLGSRKAGIKARCQGSEHSGKADCGVFCQRWRWSFLSCVVHGVHCKADEIDSCPFFCENLSLV